MKPALILFDIDGTLLLSGRAGLRAMTRAFEQAFGITDAFAGEHFGGRTDSYLVSKALQKAGMPDTLEQHERFRETYIPLLAEEIQHPGTGHKGLMPGAKELLEALDGHASSAPGAADRQLSRSRRDQAAALRAVGLLRVGRVFGRCGGSQCARADREEPRRDLRHSRRGDRSRHRHRRHAARYRMRARRPAPARSRSRPAATRCSSCASSAPTTCCRIYPTPKPCSRC